MSAPLEGDCDISRTMSATEAEGTFSVTTIGAGGTVGTKVITNGKFEKTTNQTNKQLSSRPIDDKHRTTMAGWTSSNGNDGGYNFVLDTAIIHTWDSAIWFKKYESETKRGNVFASDALSSVAYAPDEILLTLRTAEGSRPRPG